ncbi:hypothetical protein B0H14DRAFT_2638390 [Mycena olivaceomarginata]|nr:hypothetical protein B0H14DRAFT_2638390 [Mycena olivaceomarginata]
MKCIGSSQLPQNPANISCFATNIPTTKVTFHTVANIGTGATVRSQRRYVENGGLPQAPILPTPVRDEPNLPFFDAMEEAPSAIPAYETTPACNEKGDVAKAEEIHQTVAHMKELKDEEPVFLHILMSLYYSSQLNAPCSCRHRKRTVVCQDCLQAELLCCQCWVKKYRTMPTHWTLVWNEEDRFFEKHNFSLVLKNGAVRLGHYGEGCPNAEPGHSFTLVERNGIHATVIAFCGCKTVTAADRRKVVRSHFEQLLEAGIFPGSIMDPATGVPDIYKNFLAITRFYEKMQIIIESGEAHSLDIPLTGEVGLPYPNRPKGFLGLVCTAHPEPGVNMPLLVHVPPYLQHLWSLFQSLDRNYKVCLFFKCDNGSDTALTDGNMYFAKQAEFELFLKMKCLGSPKYRNTAVSGVISCACGHAVLGSFINMVKGEAFALGTYAQWEHLRHKNTPPLSAESQVPMVQSYDSYCSFVVNQTKRGVDLFPEETWLHNGALPRGDSGSHLGFTERLGSSTCQMTGSSRHNIINFVMHAWNLIKYLWHAELLAAERLDAFQLFELQMAVVEELSRQHATEVGAWSHMSRLTMKDSSGKPCSIYQHKSTKENTLAAMITVEQEKLKRNGQHEAGTPVAQALTIALLRSHREHPLQETWDSITRLRDSLNQQLKKFRQHQREICLRLTLSALDTDEPELSAIQLPSYRMKHRQQRPATDRDDDQLESKLRDTEIKLRRMEAQSAILAGHFYNS